MAWTLTPIAASHPARSPLFHVGDQIITFDDGARYDLLSTNLVPSDEDRTITHFSSNGFRIEHETNNWRWMSLHRPDGNKIRDFCMGRGNDEDYCFDHLDRVIYREHRKKMVLVLHYDGIEKALIQPPKKGDDFYYHYDVQKIFDFDSSIILVDREYLVIKTTTQILWHQRKIDMGERYKIVKSIDMIDPAQVAQVVISPNQSIMVRYKDGKVMAYRSGQTEGHLIDTNHSIVHLTCDQSNQFFGSYWDQKLLKIIKIV